MRPALSLVCIQVVRVLVIVVLLRVCMEPGRCADNADHLCWVTVLGNARLARAVDGGVSVAAAVVHGTPAARWPYDGFVVGAAPLGPLPVLVHHLANLALLRTRSVPHGGCPRVRQRAAAVQCSQRALLMERPNAYAWPAPCRPEREAT